MEQLTVMTGPVCIDGVQPGHVLAVEVLDIKASQGFDYVVTSSGFGLLKDQVKFRKKVVPIEGNRIRYSDTLSLPFLPNISKIGLAPASGSQPSGACGNSGGQLSSSQLGIGSTVFLPVFVDGGLLTIEEVHARMGDGGATASAVEIAATVTLRCQIATELPLSQPIVVTGDEVQTWAAAKRPRHRWPRTS